MSSACEMRGPLLAFLLLGFDDDGAADFGQGVDDLTKREARVREHDTLATGTGVLFRGDELAGIHEGFPARLHEAELDAGLPVFSGQVEELLEFNELRLLFVMGGLLFFVLGGLGTKGGVACEFLSHRAIAFVFWLTVLAWLGILGTTVRLLGKFYVEQMKQ